MIYDCFLFNNELDLLELRLMELGDVVDKFVLVEMPYNFQMRYKPLFYEANKARFKHLSDKIIHIKMLDPPVAKHPEMEFYQRRALFEGVKDADPSDIILLGDIDEIPDKTALWGIVEQDIQEACVFVQRLYYYYVNCAQEQPWYGTCAFRRGVAEEMDFQAARNSRGMFKPLSPGGWHFSWLGSPSDISYKLQSIDVVTDSELSGSPKPSLPDPEDLDEIQRRVDSCGDLMGREGDIFKKKLVEVQAGATHPYRIHEWLAEYPHHVKSA